MIDLGIAGNFREEYPVRAAVSGAQEQLADLGATEQDGYVDLFQMGLLDLNAITFSGGVLLAHAPPLRSIDSLLE